MSVTFGTGNISVAACSQVHKIVQCGHVAL